MRHSHLYIIALAAMFLSSSHALSTTETITNSNVAVISGSPLEALRSLRGGHIDDVGTSHKQVSAADEDREERGGSWLKKLRYQSKGAHGAEELNQITMARHYLQENPQLFNRIRSDQAKRFETYSIWRSMQYHSDEVKRAMKAHGFTKKEYKTFVEEYKNFKPEVLSFQ